MEKYILNKIIAAPGEAHRVADYDPSFTAGLTQEEAEKRLLENVKKLARYQNKMYAEDRYALLLVFQGMDGAGKDGTIKHVMSGVNPQGCQVFSFKQPSAEELDHDFLWRIHKAVPERGRIGIFNRSHYEDVLVAKVHPAVLLNTKLPDIRTEADITPGFWKRRYKQINNFEKYLTANGIVMLKFFLNVSKEEQQKRFISRLEDESKNWKFSVSDFAERKYWDDYMQAYSDMLSATSTSYAPWYVIPADNKWFMRFLVGQLICDKMKEINPKYPEVTQETKTELTIYKKLIHTEKEGEETATSEENRQYADSMPL